MIKKIITLFAIILSLSVESFAGGGSVYSRYGLGDYYYSFSARRMGFGELGIATTDFDYLNYLNPASWSKLRLTRFETGLIYNGTKISSSNESVFHSQTVVAGAMIGFPIAEDYGISFTAGITPYSKVNYEIAGEERSDLVDPYNSVYLGEGGITKAFAGMSYKLPLDISIGAAFEYYTGKIQYKTSIEFNDTSDFRDASFKTDYSYKGVGFTLGLISNNLSEIFGVENLNDVRLGLTFSNSVKLTTDSTNTSSTVIGDVVSSSGTFKTDLPYRLGIGLSLKWADNYLFLLDYLRQPLSELKRHGVKSEQMRDFQKFSFGVEYRNAESRSQSFWAHIMLRGGISYEQSQYVINGKGLNQLSFYSGFSVPLGFDNTLDLAFQYGKRGTTDNNLLTENIYKFSITLSIGEFWFIRTDR
ncbi:MAG: hypothetical protein HYS25_10440 [Ignavibacteriales bacterium]|nr:hypothetical protein [Ignavibacteriales bacterium]